jgi:uncharacterized protein YyaL (SSP411 family)
MSLRLARLGWLLLLATSVIAQEKSTDKSKHTNRLAKETSPYLLLHAHNPVDWYSWGEEALAKAKRERKLIFLSVGYSSCHWCHVMERESFCDAEIAAFLNEHFVCIKVDREERPDIDSIYMTALQIYNQAAGTGAGGGWPMSMFLTPESRPFFGGTYFPARDGDRGARTGFLTILQRVQEIWSKQPDRLTTDAETLTKMVQTELDRRRTGLEPITEKLLTEVLEALEEQYDPQHGGFGYVAAQPQTPKFPEPSNLVFLLRRLQSGKLSEADQLRARKLLVGTLEHMGMGGIRDHLGGGFHRYSVDRFWKIPHFEKMLYDNGQLATVYSEAFALTGREDFRRIVEELLSFVQRELTDAEGGFYSALDAESEDEEGKFYRWDREEFERLVNGPDRELFARAYGFDSPPNFEDRFFVPQWSQPIASFAKEAGLSESQLDAKLSPLRKVMLNGRDKRPRPLTDTKILTSWNGLMIRGFADAGRNLKKPEYIATAERAADFALSKLRNPEGRLLRTYSQGQAKLNGYLDDYAFLIDGLIALHKATGNPRWLQAADEIMAKQIELFWDEKRGGFYFTSGDHESLIARETDPVDGAEPSGNSVSADNLVYLSTTLKRPEYLVKAQRTIQAVSGLLQSSPSAAPRMTAAFAELLKAESP